MKNNSQNSKQKKIIEIKGKLLVHFLVLKIVFNSITIITKKNIIYILIRNANSECNIIYKRKMCHSAKRAEDPWPHALGAGARRTCVGGGDAARRLGLIP